MPELVDLPDRINIYPMHEPCFVLSTIINKRERKRERESRIDQPCEIFIEYYEILGIQNIKSRINFIIILLVILLLFTKP